MKIGKIIEFVKNNLFVLIVLILAIYSYVLIYTIPFNSPPIRSDGLGYYVYLPAYLIYHDFSFQKTYHMMDSTNSYIAGLYLDENGRYHDKYAIGEAIMILPFFILAHITAIILGLSANGYSFVYQHSAGLAGLAYFIFGVIILKKFLEVYFSKKITLITLVIIIFGTDLFHYATYDSIFSHIFSFFLFSSFLYLTDSWYSRKTIKKSLLIGFVMGMIFITRYPNALVWLVFPLYSLNILKIRNIKERFNLFFRENKKEILIIICSLAAVIFIQLLSWKLSAGQWVIYSYDGEGFNFSNPQIIELLFGVNKGLFFWSPALIFGIFGLFLYGKKEKLFWPSILFFVLFVYVTSCWSTISYGGSYGSRVFVETMPIFAFWIALFIKNLPGNRILRISIYAILTVMVFITVIQMIGYWQGLIPFNGTTFDVWLKSSEYYTHFIFGWI